MSQAQANGCTIEYEEFGAPGAPPLVLIMGLGLQMIAWPDALCQGLAARGFRVIRFDNRDIGLSSKWSGPRFPGLWAQLLAAMFRLPLRPPYTLDDMAEDTVGLLDALHIARAHIVGVSMGGMIAQIVATKHPERVSSLVSMMSSTGRRGLPGPSSKIKRGLLGRRPRNKTEAVDYGVNLLRLLMSPGYPTAESDLRAKVERAIARSYYPPGFGRQLIAIIAAPSRAESLRQVRAPTLVLHGEADPLLALAAARDTAAAIAGARLVTIPGWAHDLPDGLTPRLIDEIAGHCAAAQGGKP